MIINNFATEPDFSSTRPVTVEIKAFICFHIQRMIIRTMAAFFSRKVLRNKMWKIMSHNTINSM